MKRPKDDRFGLWAEGALIERMKCQAEALQLTLGDYIDASVLAALSPEELNREFPGLTIQNNKKESQHEPAGGS